MSSRSLAQVSALVLLMFAVVGSALLAVAAAGAQGQTPSLGIDTDPTGSTETSIGSVEECVEIAEGDTYEIDVFAKDVEDLLAWTANLTYDGDVIAIADVTVGFLLGESAGSDVQNVSQPVPDSDGRIEIGAFDASDPPAPDSGSGVLARVTVRGAGPGVSALELVVLDANHDGTIDAGPLLQNEDVEPIGDTDGDTFFDGPIANARIAVDASCSDQPGTATGDASDSDSGDGDDDSGSTLLIVAAAAAALAVALVVGVVALRARRRS